MKTAVPLASTASVPVVAPLMGSLMGTGAEPAGKDTLEPVGVKLAMRAVAPEAGSALANRFTDTGPRPSVTLTASSSSTSTGVTLMVSGASSTWPSELATTTVMGGTGPVKPGAGLNTYVPSGATVRVPVVTPVAGSTTGTGACLLYTSDAADE